MPVVVEIRQQKAVRLRPARIHRVLDPSSLTFVLFLLNPVHADIVAAAPYDVGILIAIRIHHENRNTAIPMELPFRVKHPFFADSILRSFRPATRRYQIATSIAIDISEAQSMAR